MKLTKEDRPSLGEAIARAEQKTGAEIVLVIKAASGRYGDVHAVVGAVAAALGLVFVLFSDWDFDPLHVVPMVAGCGGIGVIASMFAVPRFGPRRRAAQQVEEAAHAEFSRNGVHRTADRVGVLLYYSHAERTGRILFDTGVARELGADERDAWRARLPMLQGGKDLVALIDEMGERLGHVLPRGTEDEDELSNEVAA